MDTDRASEEKDERLIEAIQASILTMSEEDLDEELRALGKDPAESVASVKSILQGGVQRAKKQRLHAALEQHEQEKTRIQSARHTLPDTPEARRLLLAAILTSMPQYRPAMLTGRYRDLTSIDDDQIVEHLKELSELGVLDELEKLKQK